MTVMGLPRIATGKYVEVRWEDAHGPCGTEWVALDDIEHRASSILTVGILAHQNGETITIALSMEAEFDPDAATMVADYVVIPRPFITSIRLLS